MKVTQVEKLRDCISEGFVLRPVSRSRADQKTDFSIYTFVCKLDCVEFTDLQSYEVNERPPLIPPHGPHVQTLKIYFTTFDNWLPLL